MGLYHIIDRIFSDKTPDEVFDGFVDTGGLPRPKIYKPKNPRFLSTSMLGPDNKLLKRPATEPQDKPLEALEIQIPEQKKVKKPSSRIERLKRALDKFGGQP